MLSLGSEWPPAGLSTPPAADHAVASQRVPTVPIVPPTAYVPFRIPCEPLPARRYVAVLLLHAGGQLPRPAGIVHVTVPVGIAVRRPGLRTPTTVLQPHPTAGAARVIVLTFPG